MCQSCELINSEEIINEKELVFTDCNIDKLELVNEDHYLDELCIQFNNGLITFKINSVKKLSLWNMYKLSKFPSINNKDELSELCINECNNLIDLTDLEDFKNLEVLNLYNSKSTNLEQISFLKLKKLSIQYLNTNLPNAPDLKELNLYISDNGCLSRIYTYNNLKKMFISFSNNKDNEITDDIIISDEYFPLLKELILINCKNIIISSASNLDKLFIRNNKSIKFLPEMNELKDIKLFNISNIENIDLMNNRYIDSLELNQMNINNLFINKSLKKLSLNNLYIKSSNLELLKNLTNLQLNQTILNFKFDLKNYPHIRNLYICNQNGIEKISIENNNLCRINIVNCIDLKKIEFLFKVRNEIIISNCRNLKDIAFIHPKYFKNSKIDYFYITECNNYYNICINYYNGEQINDGFEKYKKLYYANLIKNKIIKKKEFNKEYYMQLIYLINWIEEKRMHPKSQYLQNLINSFE